MNHRFSIIVAGILFVAFNWHSNRLTAQQSPSSHRVLSAPHGSFEDLSQQFRMLQHLQQLAIKSTGANENGLNEIDPQLLAELRKMLSPEQAESLKQIAGALGLNTDDLDQLGKLNTQEIESLKRQFLEELSNDPQNAERQAKEMLRAFKGEGEFPANPKQSTGSALNSQNRQSRGASANPTTNSSQAPSLFGPGKNRQRASGDEGTGTANSGLRPTMPDNARSADRSSAGRSSSPEIDRAGGAATGEALRDSQQHGRAPTSQDDLGTSRPSSAPSIAELLEKSKRNPASLPPLNIPLSSLEDLKRLLGERLSQQKSNKRPAWVNRVQKYLPSDVRDELRQSGLEQALHDIVEHVHETSEQPSPTSTGSRTGKQPSVAVPSSGKTTMTKSLQDRISELTKSVRSGAKSSKKPSSPRKSPKPADNQASRANKKQDNPSIAKRFSEFYGMLTKRKASDNSASGNANTGPYVSLEMFAGLLICVLVGYLLYSRRSMVADSIGPTTTAIDAKKISNREELVRAFHVLTHSSDSATENWWSHRRAARVLAKARPGALSEVEILTGLYETARYSPEHHRMSESDFRTARKAVELLIG